MLVNNCGVLGNVHVLTNHGTDMKIEVRYNVDMSHSRLPLAPAGSFPLESKKADT